MIKPSEFLLDTSREYALYVCNTRAIPNVQDGLKHGQRIALWLLRNRAEKMKTIGLAGEMMAQKLYVHGDQSSANAINLLAAPYRNNVCLIEGLGQFGNRIAPVEGIGAPRYTEVKRSKAAEAFLYADLDLVPLRDNYDGSNKEPVHFLPLIPTVLLNGVEGVAVGWSTSILPRSLSGIVQATKDALDGKKTLRGLTPYFQRYDVSVNALGENKYQFSGKVTIEDTSTVRVTELPPGMNIETFRSRLITMEENDTIVSFTDRSTDAINITVKFKRGSVKEWSEDDALDFLKLREKTTERIVVIDWNGSSIRTYDDPADLVRDFVEWRLGWYTTRYEKMVRDASRELLYWRALAALFAAGFTKKLGTFADRAAMAIEVDEIVSKEKIVLDASQNDRILSLPTYRWTKDFEDEVKAKIAAIEADIAEWSAVLASPDRLKGVYAGELDALKKLK